LSLRITFGKPRVTARRSITRVTPVPEIARAFLEQVKQRRTKGRTTFVETEPVELPTGQMSQMLHTFEPILPLSLNLPQITIRRRARRIALDARGAQYRHAPKGTLIYSSNRAS
jgi:hypothetical protein